MDDYQELPYKHALNSIRWTMDDGRLPGITIQTRSQLHTMDDGRTADDCEVYLAARHRDLVRAFPVCTPVRSVIYPWIATVIQG